MARTPTPRRVDLVLEGGGVKGIGLVGALAVLAEHGFEALNLAGSSAGAIGATLSAAGYAPHELRDILLGLDYRRFEDRGWEDRVPLVGPGLSILLDQGVYEGDAFLDWIGELLERKGVRTFADLRHREPVADPRHRYRAQVIASDITARRLLVLPGDATELGFEPDELEVALAVRMSMSIPILFEPVRRRGADGREHLIVDGGVLSNFPVWLFDSAGMPRWPTFGLALVEPEPRRPVGERLPPEPSHAGPGAVIAYVRDLVATMLEAHDRMYLEQDVYVRTIPIPTLGVRTTELDLSPGRARALYDAGRAAAEAFLATWDFDAYVAGFRRRRPPSRRAALARAARL